MDNVLHSLKWLYQTKTHKLNPNPLFLAAVSVSHTWKGSCRVWGDTGGGGQGPCTDRQTEAHPRLPTAEVRFDILVYVPSAFLETLFSWTKHRTPLSDRVRSLCRLVQVQGDFETSVKDMLEGLDGLWAQLEELHTGVTLTKEGSRGHRDLDSAHTDTEVSRCEGLRWIYLDFFNYF